MFQMKYKVSVVIPVYNGEKSVARAVESVISQKDSQSIQIILVDDGSADSSGRICDGLQNKYSNVIAFHQKNAGVSAARNLGIEKSEGEWLSFLDCDDYLIDGFFEKLLREPVSDLPCCDFLIENKDFPLISERISAGLYFRKDFEKFLYPLMSEHTVFYSASNKIFRNDIVKNNSIRFPVGMKYAEDMTFVFEYVKHIDSFSFVDEKLYKYDYADTSATNTVSRSYEVFKYIYEYKSEYFKPFDSDGKIQKKLQTEYLMNSVDAMCVASKTMRLKDAAGYIRQIVSDGIFDRKYSEQPVCFYAEGFFKLINPLILKKKAFLIAVFVRLNEFRQKLFNKQEV